MKTKLAILGLVMAFFFMNAEPLMATEISVLETSGTCAGASCLGKIKLALQVSAGPLKVELLQGNTIKATKSFSKGNFEYSFENLCAGSYSLRYYPEQFPVCTKLISPIQVEDKAPFTVNIENWDYGIIKVKPSLPGNYKYSWSSNGSSWTVGTASNDPNQFPATFYVKVEDLNTGCTVVKTIQRNCTNGSQTQGRNSDLVVEVYPQSDPNKVKLVARLKNNSGVAEAIDDQVNAVKWYNVGANQPIAFGSSVILTKEELKFYELGSFVSVTVENSCAAYVHLKLVKVDCGNLDAQALRSYFVKEISPYCGVIDGKVVFNNNVIKLPEYIGESSNPVKIFVDGISRPYPISQFSFNRGGKHQFRIEIMDCRYEFEVDIPTSTPLMAFAGVQQQTAINEPSLCLYDVTCLGVKHRVTQTVIIDPGSGHQSGGQCGYDVYCDLDGMRRDVGTNQYSYEKIPAFLFRYILLEQAQIAKGNGNMELEMKFQNQADEVARLYHCHDVKYCPITFNKISKDSPREDLLSFTKGPTCDNGCWVKQCAGGVLLNACSESSYREPEGNCCSTNKVERSLLDMINAYKGLVQDNQIDGFYISQPAFRESEVELLLLEYMNSSDPRINCATIVFCPIGFKLMKYDDMSLNPKRPLDHVQCDEEVMAPPVEIAENDNDQGSAIQDKDDEVKKRKTVRCQTCRPHPHHKPGKFPRRKSTIACPKWNVKRKRNGVAIGRNIAELNNPSITALQSNERSYDAFAELTNLLSNTGEIEEILKVHTYVDTTNEQKQSRFSTIFSQGETSPKLLFTIDSVQHYYNYSHQLEDLDHFKQPDIEHLIEDWDQWRDYYIRKSVAHKEYLIAAQDSNAVWALPLSSDSLVQIEHFSRYDSTLYVAGYYQGLLYLGGQAIDSVAHYNHTGLFFLQISESGQVLNVSLAENIDTTGGIAFSENKAGIVQIAAHAQDDSIKVNGQVKVLPQAGAVFLLGYSDDQSLKFLNAVGNSASTFIAGLTLAPGGTASTMALFGAGYAQIQQAFPSLHAGDSLTLLSFDQHGNFVKARNSNAVHLIPHKFALSYGSGNGLILGVTYNQTTTLFGDTLSNEGLEDIAIMKYAANDTLKWGELYGTPDNESVSKMLYDPQGIAYFAGEFSGAQEARMIGNYIFTDTTGLPTQRVYLSYVIDTVPSVPSTPTAELLALTPSQTLAVNKAPALADAVQSLGVFPNPFTHQTTVVCTTTETGQYTLAVQNELGRVVMQQALDLGIGQQSQVLSTQQLVPGFYYLTLRNAKGKIVGAQKLIKQ